MKKHHKPLFIWVKLKWVGINKDLGDNGFAVNLMPNFLLKKISKNDMDLRPYNMVLFNYKGKTSKALRFILVNIIVGTVVRRTMFVVIPYRKNYNLLLARELIHGQGAVLSTLPQKILIWRPDGILENVKVD